MDIQRNVSGGSTGPDGAAPGRRVEFGDLRRVTPISRSFGFERGDPIDRFYIASFLERHAADVRGRVLEVGDDRYTRRYGADQVDRSDVLDLRTDNPQATIVADLADTERLAAEMFDCIVFTQTLQFIYDARAAVATLQRVLRPGGVLLGSFPVLSQICRYDMDRGGDFWRFTEASVRRLLEEAFAPGHVEVESAGNVLTAICFLHGLAAQELREDELVHRDPDYPLLVLARATKTGPAASEPIGR